MTRTVLFDVDGVLVHGYHARPERQVRWNETLLADLGVDPVRFNEDFIYDLFVKKVIVGEMALLTALDRVLPRLGYTGSSMAFVSYWLSHDSKLDTDLVAVVRRIKASGAARLFIATNQEHMRALWLWTTLGLGEVFEDILYSARLGATKPHRPFFEAAAKRIGPQTEPPLFFDDREEVIKAARGFGWEAVLYDDIADCTTHPWIAATIGK